MWSVWHSSGSAILAKPPGMAGQGHLYPFHISFPNHQTIIHYHPFLYHLTYREHTEMNRQISQELYWCSRHFTMNPRQPVFSARQCTNSQVFHFRTQALLFTAALVSAPAQIVPPHCKQKVHTGTPDIIWPVSLDSQVSVLYYSVDKRQRQWSCKEFRKQ